MIASLRGKLLDKSLTKNTAVIEAGGVGYLVNIPLCTYDALPQAGEETFIYTVMTVREDDISLYGFLTARELNVFNLLRQVNGIGAKTALGILSSMNIDMFFKAVLDKDKTALKRLDGVGPKSADRIIVELRDKIMQLAPETQYLKEQAPHSPAIDDAIAALEQLGYKRAAIEQTVMEIAKSLPENERNSQNLIRKTLQKQNKK